MPFNHGILAVRGLPWDSKGLTKIGKVRESCSNVDVRYLGKSGGADRLFQAIDRFRDFQCRERRAELNIESQQCRIRSQEHASRTPRTLESKVRLHDFTNLNQSRATNTFADQQPSSFISQQGRGHDEDQSDANGGNAVEESFLQKLCQKQTLEGNKQTQESRRNWDGAPGSCLELTGGGYQLLQ